MKVIEKTLHRATKENLLTDELFIAELKSSIQNLNLPNTYENLLTTPWQAGFESRLGLRTDKESGRLVAPFQKA